ncbi:MAG: hypothetical protein M3Z11_07025 [Candidatus Dormibacteraeota bacterium]|nr:hypothetical protein [Candidatus Dormibacteraeota bacterium]
MPDSTASIAALLHEAGATHHRVYRIVDGADPDWASWYADWLINLSELPQILGGAPVRSELVYMLVRLDREFTAQKPSGRWEDYYARELLEHFTRPSS